MKRKQTNRQESRRYERSSFDLFLVSFSLVDVIFIIVTEERESTWCQAKENKVKGSPDATIKRHTWIPGTGRLGEYTEAVGENEAQNDGVSQCLSRSLTDSQEGSELNKLDLKKEKSRHCFWNRRVSPKFELSEGYSHFITCWLTKPFLPFQF